MPSIETTTTLQPAITLSSSNSSSNSHNHYSLPIPARLAALSTITLPPELPQLSLKPTPLGSSPTPSPSLSAPASLTPREDSPTFACSLSQGNSPNSSPTSSMLTSSFPSCSSFNELLSLEPAAGSPKSDEQPPSFSTHDILQALQLVKDEEELFNSWKVLTKTKGILIDGRRLENASWRLWFQRKNRKDECTLNGEFERRRSLPLKFEDNETPKEQQQKKKRKQVRFDETLNQTAFVSYAEDNWDPSNPEMLISVDELSLKKGGGAFLRPSEIDLQYLIDRKYPSNGQWGTTNCPTSPLSPIPHSNSESLPPDPVLERILSEEEEMDPLPSLPEIAYTFSRWCTGMLFLGKLSK